MKRKVYTAARHTSCPPQPALLYTRSSKTSNVRSIRARATGACLIAIIVWADMVQKSHTMALALLVVSHLYPRRLRFQPVLKHKIVQVEIQVPDMSTIYGPDCLQPAFSKGRDLVMSWWAGNEDVLFVKDLERQGADLAGDLAQCRLSRQGATACTSTSRTAATVEEDFLFITVPYRVEQPPVTAYAFTASANWVRNVESIVRWGDNSVALIYVS